MIRVNNQSKILYKQEVLPDLILAGWYSEEYWTPQPGEKQFSSGDIAKRRGNRGEDYRQYE